MVKAATLKVVPAFLLAAVCCGGGYVEASAPGGKKAEVKKSPIVVTETETKAKLAGAGTQTAATGYAEAETVTVTNTVTTTSTTNSKLTIGVKGLTLADGSIVTINLNGAAIGTATVASGRARLSLSTQKKDTVPTVNAADVITVVGSDGSGMTVDLMTGAFGAAETETEHSGR